MGLDENLRQEIVRRLLRVTAPDRIILFGSAATGTMSPDSDVDLLIVSPPANNTINERVRLLKALRGLNLPFDVFMIDTERFEATRDTFGGIAWPASKYGQVLYSAC
jgi:predicted nucleotidyltransferase